MPDMDKVIKGLEHCDFGSDACYEKECPYYQSHDCIDELKNDILALLKEHEAVEPRRIDGKRNHFIKCGNCNYDLMTGDRFCSHCGREVKWDG